MALSTHTIQISENIFQRIYRQAQANQLSINEFVEQTLNRVLSPAIDHVPEKWRADLQQMQTMTDAMLWKIARTELSASRQKLYEQLAAARQQRPLSPTEQHQLEILCEEADMVMVRRSYAWLLLKTRGHQIPDPYNEATYG
jgi:hypothetical protein